MVDEVTAICKEKLTPFLRCLSTIFAIRFALAPSVSVYVRSLAGHSGHNENLLPSFTNLSRR
jgi:hypothetical protein